MAHKFFRLCLTCWQQAFESYLRVSLGMLFWKFQWNQQSPFCHQGICPSNCQSSSQPAEYNNLSLVNFANKRRTSPPLSQIQWISRGNQSLSPWFSAWPVHCPFYDTCDTCSLSRVTGLWMRMLLRKGQLSGYTMPRNVENKHLTNLRSLLIVAKLILGMGHKVGAFKFSSESEWTKLTTWVQCNAWQQMYLMKTAIQIITSFMSTNANVKLRLRFDAHLTFYWHSPEPHLTTWPSSDLPLTLTRPLPNLD